jgi:hypothetical protein
MNKFADAATPIVKVGDRNIWLYRPRGASWTELCIAQDDVSLRVTTKLSAEQLREFGRGCLALADAIDPPPTLDQALDEATR